MGRNHAREIDEIVEEKFWVFPTIDTENGHEDLILAHRYLCNLFHHTDYYVRFKRFWVQVNVSGRATAGWYLGLYSDSGEQALLRLILIELFKEHLERR